MRLIDVDGFTKRYKIEEKYTSLYTKFVIQEGTTCENPGGKTSFRRYGAQWIL